MKYPIPEKALHQHIVVLGKTGRGKSSAMRGGFVEPLLDENEPVCIIDPKGDWWGLKSSADGKRAGYPVVIFGGEHSDVPINEHSGVHIAELVATGNRPCIIDLGGWMVGERTRFFIAFASTLFKLTRGRRWLVMDECHNFAPQGKILDIDAGKMLHWANRLASEGRGKGINIIAASQRPQKVHKDFLTSMETLIAMGVVHKLDRDAVKDWIDGCADPATGKEVIATLAGLPRGEGWVWSPEIDFGPKRIAFPFFKTYDSFKPQAADAGKLKGWAEVDLDDVKAKLVAVVEEHKANDPAELKKQIRELERKVQAASKGDDSVERIRAADHKRDVDEARREGIARGCEVASAEIRGKLQAVIRAGDDLVTRLRGIAETDEHVSAAKISQVTTTISRPNPRRQAVAMPRFSPERPQALPERAGKISHGSSGAREQKLGVAARKILGVLSQFPDGCTSGKLTLLTGYKYSGGFQNSLSELRTAGFIEGANTAVMRITDAGMDQGPFHQLPQGEALVQHWINHPSFGKCAKAILSELVRKPKGMTADDLCKATGYAYSGGFQNSLSELRTAGVLVGKNTEVMRPNEDLLS